MKYVLRMAAGLTFFMMAGGNMTSALATEPERTANSAEIGDQIKAAIGRTNPKLAELSADVLYRDVWERPELSKRDRSLITVAALIALNRPEELRVHLDIARKNGLSESELIEVITHLAFYAGWPSAMTATVVAERAFTKDSENK